LATFFKKRKKDLSKKNKLPTEVWVVLSTPNCKKYLLALKSLHHWLKRNCFPSLVGKKTSKSILKHAKTVFWTYHSYRNPSCQWYIIVTVTQVANDIS
jgi:hypothetical protein